MIDAARVQENIEQRARTLYDERIRPVNVTSRYIISEHPSSKRIPFPYDVTSPLEVVSEPELMNVASSGNQPCIITPTSVYKTHNHAGGHADTPLHLGEEYADVNFQDSQYNGGVVVVDLSDYFEESNFFYKMKTRPITRDILERASIDQGFDYSDMRRVLFKTCKNYPSGWDENAAHFNKGSADYLASFSNIVLVGIDTQSIDFHNADIHKCAHAALIGEGIAVLEGLRFEHDIFGASRTESPVHGVLQTVWNPYQIGKDARGAIILFHIPVL